MALNTVEQVSIIRSVLDPSGYQSGSQVIQRANEAMIRSQRDVARAGQETSRAQEQAERAFVRLGTRVDPVAREMLSFARSTETANKALALGVISNAEYQRVLGLHSARVEKAVQEQNKLTASAAGVTNAFGVTARQAQQLAPQINDVATSLLGGASAFQVLTQQGGQITQAMGGVGNTFRALAGFITPANVAVVGVTAALVGAAAAAGSAESRVARLQNQLRATRSDWESYAAQVDAGSRVQARDLPSLTLGETRAVRGQLASALPSDMLANGGLERLARLSADLGRSMDEDAAQGAQRLIRAYGSLGRAVDELAERNIRGFTEEFRRHIAELVAGGRSGEAYLEFLQRLDEAVGGARDNIRGTEAATLNLRKAWENVTSAVTERLEGAGRGLLTWLGDVERGATRAGAALDIMGLALRGGASMFSGNMGAQNNLGGLLTDLVMQRINGAGSAAPSAASVSAVRRGFVPIATTDLPPEARAFLDTIAGPESGGRYDVRWGGMAGPQTITDLSRHPNIREPGPQGPSSAAGRYQITGSNWYGSNGRPGLADRYGATDFAPQTQDRVAWSWAQDTYRQQTGRELLDDLRNPQQHGTIAGALGGQSMWATLNMGRYGANLAAQGGPSAGTAASPAASTPQPSAAAAAPSSASTTQAREDQRLLREAGGGRADREAEINARINAYEQLRNRITETAEAEGRALTPDEARNVQNITERIQQQVVARDQLQDATERSIRVGREQLEVLRLEPGAQREVAQALQQAREQARGEGRSLSIGDEREVERQALERIALARQEETRATERQIVSENGIAAAYQRSIEAGREAEARARAMENARRSAVPGTAEFNRLVEEGTRLQLADNAARAESAIARNLPAQQMQLDLLREENRLVGLNAEERERRLAVLRAEQQVRLQGGDPASGAGRLAVDNARGNIAEQQAQRWNQEAENYGRQMGSAVSKYLYQGIVEGNWRGIKNLEQSLLQIAWQGLIAKPLETALSGFMASAMGGTGSSPGMMQQIGTGASGAISSALNWITGSGGGSVGQGIVGATGPELAAGGGSWMAGIGSWIASFFHSGGVVGEPAMMRAVPAYAFHGAPRYHSGGMAGSSPFASDEVPAVLRRRELVLTEGQQQAVASRMSGSGRQRPVVMNFNVRDAQSLVQSKAQVARAAAGFLRTSQRHA